METTGLVFGAKCNRQRTAKPCWFAREYARIFVAWGTRIAQSVGRKKGNASHSDPGKGRGCLIVDMSAARTTRTLNLGTLSTES